MPEEKISINHQEMIPKRRLLGQILIERKKVTADQLGQALKVQKDEGGYVGEILVKLGFLEERDIVAALVVQCHLPYIAIDRYEIDENVLRLLSGEIVRRHHVMPLDRVGDVLSLVMLDPFDGAVKTNVRHRTNCRVAPFIATRTEIEKAINRWYGHY